MLHARFIALIVLALLGLPAGAATFTVNSTADMVDVAPGNGRCDTGRINPDGTRECTLRAAVQEAGALAGPDDIVLPAGTYGLAVSANCAFRQHGVPSVQNITMRTLCLNSDLTITGAGAAATAIDGLAIDRVGLVSDGVSVTLRGVTVRNGIQLGGTYIGGGAGLNNHGTLTVLDSTVSNNVTQAGGGGAVFNTGVLTIRNSVISDNTAIPNSGDGGGVWVYDGLVTISDTLFRGNAAGNGGGAIAVYQGTLEVSGSTFLDNTGFGGGGVRTYYGVVSIANSTFSGNVTSGIGGALRTEQFGAMYLNNVTVTGNTSGQYGGSISAGPAPVYIRNSIVAGNRISPPTSGGGADCIGTLHSEGYNLFGSTANCTLTGDLTGNILNVDARLGAVALNGGPTPTVALLDTSPAINAGAPAAPGSAGTACVAFDQRGALRPQGARCDIGAFERDGAFVVTSIVPAKAGSGGSSVVVVSGGGFATGATVRLRRSGYADVVGAPATVEAGGYSLATAFDLGGVAAGAWDVVVTNGGGGSTALPAAFTVQAPAAPQLWSYIVGRSAVRPGVPARYTLVFGNRGNVDALAVPLTLNTPGSFGLNIRFDVMPPPAQSGQVPLALGADTLAVFPYALQGTLNVPLLLPVVPAGFSGALDFSLWLDPSLPHGTEFTLYAGLGDPMLKPAPDTAALQRIVDGAVAYAAGNLQKGVPTSALPAVHAYAFNQLTLLADQARAELVSSLATSTPVASLSQLNIDAGYFAASLGASTASKAGSATLQKGGSTNPCSGRILAPGESCSPTDQRVPPPEDKKPPNGIHPGDCTAMPNHRVSSDGKSCEPIDKKGCPTIPTPFFTDPNCGRWPIVNSYDPNEKNGARTGSGVTAQRSSNTLPYAISFENLATTSAAAQEVVITDQLDKSKVDLSTFSLGPLSFGNKTVVPPPGQTSYVKILDMRPTQDMMVRMDARLDVASGVVTWRFSTLDPLTGSKTEDPFLGFLPPNSSPPAGEGRVAFTVLPKQPAATGLQICNQASIVFDFNAPIVTNRYCNTMDDVRPVSRVQALAAQQPGSSFDVQWSGTDQGSAIGGFDVFVSDNGGPFVRWQDGTTLTKATYAGTAGHTYGFYSIATDQAGNAEVGKSVAEAITNVGAGSTCASDVGAKVQVSRSGFVLNRTTGRFVQTVTVKNVTGAALPGRLSLVLDGLSAGVSLWNASGTTSCALPAGRPYVDIAAPLAAGASTSVNLQFVNPAKTAISYGPRVLAGGSL